MERRRDLTTTGTDGDLITMSAVKVQNFLLPAPLNPMPHHDELGQVQQLADGNFSDLVDDPPHRLFGSAGGVLQQLDNIGQRGTLAMFGPPSVHS